MFDLKSYDLKWVSLMPVFLMLVFHMLSKGMSEAKNSSTERRRRSDHEIEFVTLSLSPSLFSFESKADKGMFMMFGLTTIFSLSFLSSPESEVHEILPLVTLTWDETDVLLLLHEKYQDKFQLRSLRETG